jgi:hypothetical protein
MRANKAVWQYIRKKDCRIIQAPDEERAKPRRPPRPTEWEASELVTLANNRSPKSPKK